MRVFLGGLILMLGLVSFAPAAEVPTGTLSENGWYSDDTRADGLGAQAAGTNLVSPTLTDAPENAGGNPAHDADINLQIQFVGAPGTVPAGTHTGAAHLTIAAGVNAGKSQISHRKDDGVGHAPGSVLAPGVSAEYSWMGDGTATVTTSFKLGIKTSEFGSAGVSSRTGENVWDKVLIYEPGQGNGINSDGLWKTETIDYTTGKWWFFDRITFGASIGTPLTLSDMSTSTIMVGGRTIASVFALMTAPGAHITSVQFGIGSSNAGGSVYVNQLETNFYRPGDTTVFGPVPTVLNVNSGLAFADLQSAHDASTTLSGDTLRLLGDEHFVGQVVFTKSIVLEGEGCPTVVKMTVDTGSSGDARGWFVIEAGAHIAATDLTFDGNGRLVYQAFRCKGTGSFTNCTFRDLRFNESGPHYNGSALVMFGGNFSVTDCAFENIGRIGILAFGAGLTGSTVDGMTYVGKGDGDFLDYAMDISAGANVTVRNLTVSDCRGVASSDGSGSAGLLVSTFFGAGTTADIEDSTFLDNSVGVNVGFNAADTATALVAQNHFDGNGFGVISTSSSVVTDATNNYWGDASGPLDSSGATEADNPPCAAANSDPLLDVVNIDGLGDEVGDGNVDYCPWLTTSPIQSGTLELATVGGLCLGTPQIEIELSMLDLTQTASGFQAFLEYDTSILSFRGDLSTYSAAPFSLHIQSMATAEVAPGEINVDGADIGGGGGTSADSLLATLVFDVLGDCDTTEVGFRNCGSPTKLSFAGVAIPTTLVETPVFTVDVTPPVITFCPPDLTIECDEDTLPGSTLGTAVGGIGVYYNNNGGGENPANQSYLKAQFSQANTNGAEFTFSTAPIAGNGLSWNAIFSGFVFPSQHGLDLLLPAPTADGTAPPPPLDAFDNVDSTVAGATNAGPVVWGINDYKGSSPSGPANPANSSINTAFRSNGLDPGAVLFNFDVSQAGPIFTAEVSGVLTSDGLIHWFGPTTGSNPNFTTDMIDFGMNGLFYFSGTLTYDSTGDTGVDLVDFYSGSIDLVANSSNAALGLALATDNCSAFPTIFFTDVVTPGACADASTIERTWHAVDDCGNETTCLQTITILDTTAPEIVCPANIVANAEAGSCAATVTITNATATDNCDPSPAVTGVRSDAMPLGAPYPTGVTTITWTATDACGNASTPCMSTVTIDAVTEVTATVVLDGVNAADAPLPPMTRCIKFTAKDGLACAAPVSVLVDFTGFPATGVATFLVECGTWTDLCAKDEQHTLSSSTALLVSGTTFDAPGALTLLSGDNDNDDIVDIDDVTFWLLTVGGPETVASCPQGAAERGSDFSKNGNVGTEDYVFLSTNWLMTSGCPCALPVAPPTPLRKKERPSDRNRLTLSGGGGGGGGGGGSGGGAIASTNALSSTAGVVGAPKLKKSVQGMPAAARARVDLNADGFVDVEDVRLFEKRHRLPSTLSDKMGGAKRKR